MEEGTSKAIPLRRSRAVAVRQQRWVDRIAPIAAGMRAALAPPRQLWLASLGGSALTLRGARSAWLRLVAEGTAVEGWLRGSLGRGGGQTPAAS